MNRAGKISTFGTMEGSVRGQGVIVVVMGVGKGREQGGQENQQLAHPCKVWGGLKHVGAECAQWRVVQKNWLWFSRGCEAARPRGGASQRRGIRRKCWRRQRQHKWQLSRVVRQPGGPIPTCACTRPSRQQWQLRAQLQEHSIGLVAGLARPVQSPRQSCTNAVCKTCHVCLLCKVGLECLLCIMKISWKICILKICWISK